MRLLEALEGLSEEERSRDWGASNGGVVTTLGHVFQADRVWLGRIQMSGQNTLAHEGEMLSVDLLRREWPPLLERWKAWAAGLTDEGAAEVLRYRNLKGVEFQSPYWKIVLHVVNHGTLHRGQVMAMLRQMGHAPPGTDLIFYYNR